MTHPNFSGPVYNSQRDHTRLHKQHERIRDYMLDGIWRTIKQIARATNDPENSIQAQLRHLRKPRFGCFIVEKRRHGATWEYRLRRREPSDPPYQGGRSTKNLKAQNEELREILDDALKALDDTGDLFARAKANEIRKKL